MPIGKKISIFIIFITLATPLFSQEKKGEFYAYWGWNRAWYSNSDIHFKGDNYNFTLYDVIAKDRQTPFGIDPYFKLNRITIPQVNYKLGYYVSNKVHVSLGVDHMKYVMQQNQSVSINGEITNTNTLYDKVYNNENIVLSSNFLKFEHTDGLNYINAELNHLSQLIKIEKLRLTINFDKGLGVGALYPKTNCTLLNNERNDEFHLAGFGASAKIGLNLTFFQHFFIQSELKSGYINMPNIRTTKFPSDRANQHFWFLQSNILFGGYFNLPFIHPK